MAQYSKGISIAFNDNDGGATHSLNPSCYSDFERHYKCLGKIKARWFFFKIFWRSLLMVEDHIDTKFGGKRHKFKV